MKPKILILTVLFILLTAGTAQAVPTTGSVTSVGNNNFTISATGCASDGCWFEYGPNPDILTIWTTEQIPVGGSITHNEYGSPIMTDTTYYIAACDNTGCGATVSFTTLPYTTLPESTLGYSIHNMTESKFDLLVVASNILVPYAWLFPSSQSTLAISIVCGMMFFFIYYGMLLRQRSVAGPVILGLLTSTSLMFSNKGLNLGIPVEFQAIAQGLLYASLAGIFLAILKR